MALRNAFTLTRIFLVLAGLPAGFIVYWTWSAPVVERYEQCATWQEWSSAMMDVADRAIVEDPQPDTSCSETLDEDDARTESVACLLQHYKYALQDLANKKSGPLEDAISDLQQAAAAFHLSTQITGESMRRNGDRDRHLHEAVEYLRTSIARFDEVCRRGEP
jgi:hypothetical protein